MMGNPLTIAAVVPTANREDLLLRALRSISTQVRPPDEIVVVDNGTRRVLSESLPTNVRVHSAIPGCGASKARNIGAQLVESDYVAFLDDDDYWLPEYLYEVEAVIQGRFRRPDLVIARKDIEIDGVVSRYKNIRELDGIYDKLMRGNPGIGGQNVTVLREYQLRTGGFRTSLGSSHDRALLIDALDGGAEVALAPKAVVVKVMHGRGQITDGTRMLRYRSEFLRVYWGRMTWSQRRHNVIRVLQAVRKVLRRGVRRPVAALRGWVRR